MAPLKENPTISVKSKTNSKKITLIFALLKAWLWLLKTLCAKFAEHLTIVLMGPCRLRGQQGPQW